MTSFTDLGLSEPILQAIEACGYTIPTPIQAQAIPVVLMGRDVMGCAQTGTGKTAGFTLPMIEILAGGQPKARMPRSLILEPTRELAAQVAESFEKYGSKVRLSHALLIGGEAMDEQIKRLERGVDVLIATPGRLLDLFERGQILLNDIKIFVIDEADRMLDMGFIPDIQKISGLLPKLRQTLFFSATMAPEMRKLAAQFLSNPREISVAPPATTSATVEQFLIRAPETLKRLALRWLLKAEDVQNAMIFCNRKVDVALVAASLKRHGFNAGELHGDLPQDQRTATLDSFRSGELAFLVCSDVAARGLDVKGVSHVFNFDVPFNAEDYVHRIGRTGRAGRDGRAFTLVSDEDTKFLDAIHKLIRQDVKYMELPPEAYEGRPAASRRDRMRRGAKGGDRGGRFGRERGDTSGRDKPHHSHRIEIIRPGAAVAEPAVHQAQADSAGRPPSTTQRDLPPAASFVPQPRSVTSSPLSYENFAQRESSQDRVAAADNDFEDSGNSVAGFGDDIPAFMRPFNRSRN